MELAALVLDVLGPVVAVVALGALAGPRLRIDIASLSSLAWWVLGPAFVFDLFVAGDLAGGVVARLAVAGLAGMAAAVAVSLVGNRLVGSSRAVTSAGLMTSAYGNVGNAGLAITAFALGETGLAAAGVLLLVVNIAGVTLGVGLATGVRAGGALAVRQALLAPMTVAGGAALLLRAVDLTPPLVAARAVGLLADAMIPVMLFTLGLQLAATGVGRPTADLGVTAVAKLAVAPVAATAAGAALGLEGAVLGAVTIQSAMPPAVFCMLVALEHDLVPDRVTTTVVTTTAAALVTVPVVLAIVGT